VSNAAFTHILKLAFEYVAKHELFVMKHSIFLQSTKSISPHVHGVFAHFETQEEDGFMQSAKQIHRKHGHQSGIQVQNKKIFIKNIWRYIALHSLIIN